jgi:hypothetical protein
VDVTKKEDRGTYRLAELDGTELEGFDAGDRVKKFGGVILGRNRGVMVQMWVIHWEKFLLLRVYVYRLESFICLSFVTVVDCFLSFPLSS